MQQEEKRFQNLKIFGGLSVLAFAITFIATTLQRLSEDAINVLGGAVLFTAIAIPVALLFAWIAIVIKKRRLEAAYREKMAYQHDQQPGVVVMNGSRQAPNVPALPSGWGCGREQRDNGPYRIG
jgi:hypothetical protein